MSIKGNVTVVVKDMFSALAIPNYRMLFMGRLTSNSGRTLRVFARAIWVFDATGSPLRMGIAVSALSWPMLFMPLIGGVVADRVDRRTLLLWTEGLLVVLWAAVALLITLNLFTHQPQSRPNVSGRLLRYS